ncbi:MAG: type II toxin-antitoxin system RelE/ParE family toxin [Aliidongia sp.]
MTKRPVTVTELGTFLRSASAAGMADEERAELVDHLARNPFAGDLIRDTGGLRKLRWARAGAGQSGGYRAVYYFYDEAAQIYAVYVYGKNQRAVLSAEQRKAAARFIAEIKLAIKAGRRERGTI